MTDDCVGMPVKTETHYQHHASIHPKLIKVSRKDQERYKITHGGATRCL